MAESSNGPEGMSPTAVEKLRHEFDRWLEMAVSQGERALDAFGLRGPGRTWLPEIDLVETPDEIFIDVDLPGIEASAVEITLAGNMLSLKGNRKPSEPREGRQCHVSERRHGGFLRMIPMPAAVDADKVSAEAKDGVLHIRLAKSERSKSRHIPVNVRQG